MSAIASRLWFLGLISCGVLPLLASVPVQAQSIRAEPNSAGTVVDQNGNRFTITGGTQSGSNLFHSFEQFGLSAAEIASFVSRPDIQNILGRVTGGQASLIDGLLEVTGGNSNLYLLNPAGILFGANARLDLPASFYATTATGIGFGNNTFNAVGSNNYAALIGNPDSFAFTLSQAGAIVNAGNLVVNPGESVGLIGGTVVNTGTISAPGGTITLAAIPGANRVRVSQIGSLLSLELEPPDGSWDGINPLPFTPLSLPELLTGGDIATATGLVTNPDGTIRLSSTSVPIQPGTAITSGTLNTATDATISTDAMNRVSAVPQINVLGDRVALLAANLNASATNGGGTVRIGGDYQGQGSVFNASRTFVSQDSTITADALESGNGGRAIVWADETTRFLGTISAQGGQTAGDGGFVEVSGAQNLLFEGLVNVGATNGQLGTLLLDPTNITIWDSTDSPGVTAALPDIFAADLPGDVFINSTTLAGQTGNIILEATNDITIRNVAGGGIALNFVPGGSITFTADSDGSGAGDFIMNAGSSIDTAGRNITISGTNLTLTNLETGSNGGNAPGGVITLTATEDITVDGLSSANFPITGDAGDGGAITLNAGGDITISPVIGVRSFSQTNVANAGDGGAISFTAGGDITVGNILDSTSSGGLNSGDGGAITLTSTAGSITTGGVSASSSSNSGTAGTGGAVTFTATAGSITTGSVSTFSSITSGTEGTGGAIALTARDSVTATSLLSDNTDITLTGNEIDFDGFSGQDNNITLQPFSPDRAIAINGVTDSGTATLDLLSSEISLLFSIRTITIGREGGSGTVTVNTGSYIGPSNLRGASTLISVGDAIWRIDGTNSGTLDNLSFTSVPNLRGGDGNDTFTLFSGGSLTGTISGGGGTNTLRGGSASPGSGDNNWVITGSNAGSLNGTAFTEFQSLEGSSGADSFEFRSNTQFTGNINDNGGVLRLTGDTVNLTGNITAFNSPLTIEASQGNINVRNITTGSSTGGSITLTARSGAITTGNLSTAASTSGGAITIIARDAITISTIDTSGNSGNGGNVTLDPSGDIQVTSINADGGTSGRGGTVDITTGRFFRATGSFTNRNGLLSSISAAGGTGNGTVIIRHGGNGATPFVIGANFRGSDLTGINGTAAAITNGTDTFSVGESFNSSITRGNLQLITGGDGSGGDDPDECDFIDCGDDDDYDDEEYDYEEEEEYYIEEPLARESLLAIQQQTGIRPALIYVSFVSTDVPIATTFERQEAIATQQFASHLDRPNPTQPPTLAIAPQDTDELTLLLVTPDGENIYRRIPGVTRAEVIEASQQLRAAVTNPRLVRTRTYLPAAKQLYDWMIAPLQAELQAEEIKNIGFILDSGLRTIPLAALHDGQGFLIENYSIGLMPSLNLVDTRYEDIRDSAVLAAGTSDFRGFGLDPLPAVPAEIEAISNLWEGQTSTLEGNQFTIAQLQAARLERPFGIVHLATHGEFVPGNLANSYIQFSDTRLRLDQIRTLGFNDPPVELMVLSACRMALGSETAELGFAGLAVQAGVKTALASLWSISDEGTLGLMTEFYEELRTQPIKAEALRQAQLAMAEGRVRVEGDRLVLSSTDGEEIALDLPETLDGRGDRDFIHPYYWAGFTLVGSPW
ncbi:CHAT domain-containing protein [Oscillatoria sp. FACHB-1407]|uniref:CHAT domain-containing protein n=1 Tax=Oscillatoria sp. FACHB-1407 TaxID=2692847 RepID=UPI001688D672|nr:CHAT domain-containing protein [Oscillatoria sp. FACHB-1407]MBD2463186.1 CHAT domain-containing protein [Oscillatoria sp. FACHB-1407]